MSLEIVRNDITRIYVDAIVNVANVRLAPGDGGCGAIFAAAGLSELMQWVPHWKRIHIFHIRRALLNSILHCLRELFSIIVSA
ncbi:MAG: hypothetical protein ACI3VN_02110 [Candidatus Onthomonas sp.]